MLSSVSSAIAEYSVDRNKDNHGHAHRVCRKENFRVDEFHTETS